MAVVGQRKFNDGDAAIVASNFPGLTKGDIVTIKYYLKGGYTVENPTTGRIAHGVPAGKLDKYDGAVVPQSNNINNSSKVSHLMGYAKGNSINSDVNTVRRFPKAGDEVAFFRSDDPEEYAGCITGEVNGGYLVRLYKNGDNLFYKHDDFSKWGNGSQVYSPQVGDHVVLDEDSVDLEDVFYLEEGTDYYNADYVITKVDYTDPDATYEVTVTDINNLDNNDCNWFEFSEIFSWEAPSKPTIDERLDKVSKELESLKECTNSLFDSNTNDNRCKSVEEPENVGIPEGTTIQIRCDISDGYPKGVSKTMAKQAGRVATILGCSSQGKYYKLDIDNGVSLWPKEALSTELFACSDTVGTIHADNIITGETAVYTGVLPIRIRRCVVVQGRAIPAPMRMEFK